MGKEIFGIKCLCTERVVKQHSGLGTTADMEQFILTTHWSGHGLLAHSGIFFKIENYQMLSA